jgi:hypothetical protein
MAEFESRALRKIFPVLVTGEPPGHDEDGGPVDHGLVVLGTGALIRDERSSLVLGAYPVRRRRPHGRRCRRDRGTDLGLAVELAPVRVNAVRPGAVHTPMWDAAPEPQRSALLGALAVRTITKTVGEPDQIAAPTLYLMDNASSPAPCSPSTAVPSCSDAAPAAAELPASGAGDGPGRGHGDAGDRRARWPRADALGQRAGAAHAGDADRAQPSYVRQQNAQVNGTRA